MSSLLCADLSAVVAGRALSADMSLLACRCNDVSLACRKAAVTALTSLLLTAPTLHKLQVRFNAVTFVCLSFNNDYCIWRHQSSYLCKISAVLCSTACHVLLQDAWIRSVLPLASDPEASCQVSAC
jgi:hypothetical protein